jgi:hypothetical protein
MTHAGAPMVSSVRSATCANSQVEMTYPIATLKTLRRFNSPMNDKGWLLCVHYRC